MTKGIKIALIVTGAVLGACILTGAGFVLGRFFLAHENKPGIALNDRNGYGSRMQFRNSPQSAMPCNPGRRGDQFGQGLIVPPGRMGQPGMMGQPGNRIQNWQGQEDQGLSGTPLTVDAAKAAVDAYLARLNNPDLKVAEVILFSNNVYARIVESSTGTGAMELLVLENGRVTQEMGANMMWNLKYGMMRLGSQASDQAMTVTADQALADAQKWLDANIPAAKVAASADAFYGYYTIEYLVDGKIAGMVSVNGFTGDIFPHTWHGTFVDIKEY